MATHIPPIASPPPSPRRSTSRRLSSPAVLTGAALNRSPHRPRTVEGVRPKLDSLGLPEEGHSPRPASPSERLSQTLPRRSSSGTSGNYPNLLLSQTLPRPSTSGGCRSNASSPFSSPRPPSSPSGRNGMQSSPLSRRYDLKPPVPPANAPSPYQANAPAPLQNAALFTRITQMRLPEAASVMDAILTVEGEGESELTMLCEAFHQRVAEIFNNLQLAGLGPAVALITKMSEAMQMLPLLKPEEKLKGLLESRLNCFLHQSARILDARVENNVHSNRNAQGGMLGEFDHLLLCHEHAEMLAHNGLASLKSVKKTMEHLLRLVESAPLVDLQHRVCELLKTGERSLEEGLMDRLRHASMKNRTFVDMRAVADAVVTIHQKMELPLFIPALEETLCVELPGLVKAWNLERLQMECDTEAGLQTMTRSSNAVWESVNTELSSRLFQWMQETISSLRQSRGLDKAQAEIGRWKKMALRAISVGLVVFAPEMKDKIISLFSRCYDDCLGNPNLSHQADEIDRMLFQVAVIMGADRRANPAELRKAGTFAKPALPRISVSGCG